MDQDTPLRATRPGPAVTGPVGIGEAESAVARSISPVESVFLPSLGKLAQAGNLACFTDTDRALRVWVADAWEGIV
jgi:hypothetical protein